MFQNTQEMLSRRKLEEQAELQQAIELQGRRLMNLQLLDFKNHNHGGNPDAAPSRNGVADGELKVNLVNSHTNGNSNNCSTEEKSSTEETDLYER